MKSFNKNQIIISVVALMLITAGYLSFSNNQKENINLIATSSLADSEEMASIGDATLVSANQATQNQNESMQKNTTNNTSEIVNENTNSKTENKTNYTNSQAHKEDSYFTQSKLDRDSMYSQMLENYQKLLENSNISSEEKTSVQEEIKKINQEKNAIMIAENLIKTKGFEDIVIFVNNGNVSVVIKTENLKEDQIAQIQNIITRELNVKVNKINVSNKK